MTLSELTFQFDCEELSPELVTWIESSQVWLTAYWDQFAARPLSQYVECDFAYVASALSAIVHQRLNDGNLFVEWGCGLGVITGVASLLGLEAIGIEAEEFLVQEARKLLAEANIPAEIWHGNFLPDGARHLATRHDPVVSLTHDIEPAYVQHGLDLEDFATVFSYPWPGEEHFLKLVFEKYARTKALLVLFRGPYHLELYRKR
jgi:hypothetical protein